MFRPRRLPAFLAVVLLAFPAGALAQSAGDEQYQDPLAGGPPQQGGSGDGGGGSNTSGASSGAGQTSGGNASGSASGSGPSHSAAPSADASPGAAPSASRPTGSAGELPRTGGEPILVAAFGAALLLIGTALRLAAPRRS